MEGGLSSSPLSLPVPSPDKGGGLKSQVSSLPFRKTKTAQRTTQSLGNGKEHMMTTRQRNRKRLRIFNKNNTLRIATWNITSWTQRDQETIMEISQKRIDICCISETKKKGKGIQTIGNYLFIYSGKNKNDRAKAGVGILLHKQFEQNIDDIEYMNENILRIDLTISDKHIHVLSIYAPDISKPREERKHFYEDIQYQLDKIPQNQTVILMGDFNARVGNDPIAGVKQRFNEETQNDNGDLLIDLCTQNNLRINNTFFDHKWQYKYTWSNTRGQHSVIDYVITNRQLTPTQILDVRTLNSSNIGTDHDLVLCKIRIKYGKPKPKPAKYIQKLNIESLEDDTIKELYHNRLQQKIYKNSVEQHDTPEEAWRKLRTNIMQAAEEAVGRRKVSVTPSGKTKPWFTEEVKQVAAEKKKAYLRFKTTGTEEDRIQYIRERNATNLRIRQIKEEYWESFTKGMERDIYGAQKKVWKMLRNRKCDITEMRRINKIEKDQWKEYFQNLYKEDGQGNNKHYNNEETHTHGTNSNEHIDMAYEEITSAILTLKNRKAPGQDEISNELLKYGGKHLNSEITKLYRIILERRKVPTEWKTSVTVPLFKKGNKRDPGNYRGITLLTAAQKLLTKILLDKIQPYLKIREEQQGFRRNRSTTDAIFIVRQVAEKAIEFAKPAYICFVDLTKAFDRVQLQDILNILQEKMIPRNIIEIIKDLNTSTKTKIKVDGELTEEIDTPTGIRQGDSLSPVLFNTIMDKIIGEINRLPGYQLGNKNINVVCYADDAILIADTEDKLQMMLHKFNTSAKLYNMKISTEKTKSLTIAKEPLRCKLELEGNMIEQVMSFKYLGVIITSNQNINNEVKAQVMKGSRISGLLKDITWKNKYMSLACKTKIYKTIVRPVMTYGAETRADTCKTKRLMRTAEMSTLRAMIGKTRLDRVRNADVRQQCNVTDIVKFTKTRKKEWNNHVSRADSSRLVRIARDLNPQSSRNPGRPPKRWIDSWNSSMESP